jgi:hypothetical protein
MNLCRGGLIRSSIEASVMAVERRDQVIQSQTKDQLMKEDEMME